MNNNNDSNLDAVTHPKICPLSQVCAKTSFSKGGQEDLKNPQIFPDVWGMQDVEYMKSLGVGGTMAGLEPATTLLMVSLPMVEGRTFSQVSNLPENFYSILFIRYYNRLLKKSLPLSSTMMKAGKFSTVILKTASIPSSSYSTSSTFLMKSFPSLAAGPPGEPR